MKAGDHYVGGQGKIEIETDPFEVRSMTPGVNRVNPIKQVRVKFIAGQRMGELAQWAVSYVESNFSKVES